MNAVAELRITLDRYARIGGGGIREFLKAENERIGALGVEVRDSARLPADDYVRSPDLGARFLLGQLREIFVSDLRGELLIATMGVWMAQTVKFLDEYDLAINNALNYVKEQLGAEKQ